MSRNELRPLEQRGDRRSQETRTLEARLDDGYWRIEQARARGEDVSAWEDFWIDLLRQYERAASPLPEAA